LKKILLIASIFLNLKALGQDMIYFADGASAFGKIENITSDSIVSRDVVCFVGHLHSYSIPKVRVAFNLTGNYLIFNQGQSFSESEKKKFILGLNKFPSVTIAVDLKGKLFEIATGSESATAIKDDKKIKLLKDSLAFVIRKNGTHELFCSAETALPYLIKFQTKIDSLIATTPLTLQVAPSLEPRYFDHNYDPPDMTLVANKAFQKMQTFNRYLHSIIAKNSNEEEETYRVIYGTYRHGIFFFRGINSLVEVFNPKTREKRILKVTEFISELKQKSEQLERVDLAYADIYYSSEFRKGDDGAYYGTVTFMQKAGGFSYENIVFSAKIKQNLAFMLPARGGPNLEQPLGWEVYLGKIGVVETEK
jgi:hypothetical protein